MGPYQVRKAYFSKLGWPFRYLISKTFMVSDPPFFLFLTQLTHYIAVAKFYNKINVNQRRFLHEHPFLIGLND